MKTNKRENVMKSDYSTISPSIENFSKISKAAIHIYVQVFVWICFQLLWVNTKECLDQMMSIFSFTRK